MMKLSVVIPCYNSADTLGEQLEALSQQQWKHPWEVLVVNNCCTDGSMQIVDRYKSKIKNLKSVDALAKKNKSYARNTGVEQAQGELIAFCDADDVVGEDWLPAIGKALFEHDFVACRSDWKKLNNFSEEALKMKVGTGGLVGFSLGEFLPHGCGGTLGIRKHIHNEVNGFDEALPYVQDMDYCWRIQLKGYSLTFVSDALIHYRARSNHFKMFKQELHWAEYDIYMYKKYESYGMPEYSIKKTFRSLYHVLRATRWFFSNKNRSKWVIRLALQLGRINGTLKYKLFEYGLFKQNMKELFNER